MRKMKSKGFTIIELIVVIAIVAVLATIIITSVNQFQTKGRDAKRIADLNQMQKALEMYKIDNGKYPSSGSAGCTGGGTSWCYSANTTEWNLLGTILKNYMGIIPKDPVNTGGGSNPLDGTKYYNYAYLSGRAGGQCADGSCYDLLTNLEDVNSSLRCEIKLYTYYGNTPAPRVFCGAVYPNGNQIYSPH